MVRKSWSYASDRRVIELAKAPKSLEESARIMKPTPERIRKAMRLGVSFKTEKKEIIGSLVNACLAPLVGLAR